jgi:hypothetical protein
MNIDLNFKLLKKAKEEEETGGLKKEVDEGG